jgi:hypothetical protein
MRHDRNPSVGMTELVMRPAHGHEDETILLQTADDIATVLEHQSAQKYACNGLTSKLPALSAAMASATASAPDMVV